MEQRPSPFSIPAMSEAERRSMVADLLKRRKATDSQVETTALELDALSLYRHVLDDAIRQIDPLLAFALERRRT